MLYCFALSKTCFQQTTYSLSQKRAGRSNTTSEKISFIIGVPSGYRLKVVCQTCSPNETIIWCRLALRAIRCQTKSTHA